MGDTVAILKNSLEEWKIYRARKKRGIPRKIVPTGHEISMVRRGWGHDLCKWEYSDDLALIRTGGWCSPRPRVGDRIRILAANGVERAVMVYAVEYLRDPDDMFWAWVGPTE